MLRKHELRTIRPTGTRLTKFAEFRVEQPIRAAIHHKAANGVVEHVGHLRKDRPPIAGRSGGGTRISNWVSISEQHVVEREHRRSSFSTRNLSESRHVPILPRPELRTHSGVAQYGGVTDTDFAALADQDLITSLDNGVLWLTINRAQAGNAIPFYVRDRLIEVFRDAHTNLAVRAIVLTGAGEKHFCTGADLSVRPPMPDRPEGAPERVVGTGIDMMRRGFQTLMQVMLDCEKPIIVAMNGTAAGGGSMFTLAADLVIAADTAKLIQVFVRRGLVPDGGVAYLLPRIVGMHKAKELIFFGDDLDAQGMKDLGIANKVVPAAELHAAAKQWADRLASGPTKAIGWSKKLLHDATELDRRSLLEQEAMLVELNTATHDGMEGVNSFREKRPVEFTGW